MDLDVCKLSNEELTERMISTVREERRLTVEVLHLLREVERRELFARMGYSSLFTYCVEHLKYSESAAQRRIVAMRAIRELPELEDKIERGILSLSVLALTESSLRQNAKRENRKVDLEQRRTVLREVEGLSRRQAEVALHENFNLAPPKFESTERPLTSGGVRIVLELTAEEMTAFDELRRLSSRSQTAKEMILSLVRAEAAKKKRRLGEKPLLTKRTPRLAATTATTGIGRANLTTSAGRSDLKDRLLNQRKAVRAISNSDKRSVWLRAEARCEYQNDFGDRCGSKHSLEFDHIVPRSHEGSDEPENLRLLCRAHHRLVTTEVFGRGKMQRFRPTLEGPRRRGKQEDNPGSRG